MRVISGKMIRKGLPKYEIDKEIDKQDNEKNRQYSYTQEIYIYISGNFPYKKKGI